MFRTGVHGRGWNVCVPRCSFPCGFMGSEHLQTLDVSWDYEPEMHKSFKIKRPILRFMESFVFRSDLLTGYEPSRTRDEDEDEDEKRGQLPPVPHPASRTPHSEGGERRARAEPAFLGLFVIERDRYARFSPSALRVCPPWRASGRCAATSVPSGRFRAVEMRRQPPRRLPSLRTRRVSRPW